MIPLSNLLARIRTRFHAESSVRWSDSAITSSVNEGLDEVSEGARFIERVVSIPITMDRTFYDLCGYLPDDFIALKAIWSTVRQDWLVPTTEGRLASENPRWIQVDGDPYSFFLRGWSWLGVYPHASASTGYLRAYVYCLAPQFLHSQSVLADLPDNYAPALEDYALYDLQAQDGETDKALMHWKDFAARQKSFTDFVSGRGKSSGFIGGRR